MLQRCNELGILVQEKIPFVNQATFAPEFEKNLQTMAWEMVTQHINHPCIIVWGMGNEIHMNDRGDGKAKCYDIISNLHSLIHELDPSRKTLLVSNDSDTPSKLGVMDIPDLIGYNLYQGWYGENLFGLAGRAKHFHQLNPDKPILVTEFGAGSDQRLHSATPARYDFTEDYQVKFLEAHFDQRDNMPRLAGFNWWAFADFGSSHQRGSIPHVNQKGLVTFSRERKDSSYLWKARLSMETVIRVQSAAWAERHGHAKINARVITNIQEVELIHNGKSLDTQSNNFTWPVTMVPGANTLDARGKDAAGKAQEHRMQLDYKGRRKRLSVSGTSTTRSFPDNLVDQSSFTHWFARTPPGQRSAWKRHHSSMASLSTPIAAPSKPTSSRSRVGADDKWEILWSGETTLGKEFKIPQEKQVEWRYLRIDSAKTDKNRFLAIVGLHVSQSASDYAELENGVASIPARLGKPESVLADAGHVNADSFDRLEQESVEIYCSVHREDAHNERRYDFRPGSASARGEGARR